jgi:signal transduction histidine kinase
MFGPMVAATPDGKIWVATDGGVASMDPRYLPPATAPPVLIEALRVDGRAVSLLNAVTISPGAQELEIDYTTTSLSTPERHQFRYRLESQDTSWHDVGTRRRAYYTGLGPGSYRFRVSANNGDRVWNDTEAVLAFRVLPAWHQTVWFRAGGILLIGALSAGAAVSIQRRRHLRVQVALKREYDATLAERARIAQDLHDTLLQGFAGVTLELKTAELALPERPDVAAETITRVQQLARTSLREARVRVWDMREIDLGGADLPTALEALARERTLGTGIDVAVTATGDRRHLTRTVEDAAFRIGREAIVNALRHAEARRIEIEVEFGATQLGLEVRDDGRGFTPDEAADARKRGHFGLTGVRERAASIGGRCDVRARPGGGTVVDVELPLAESGPH